MLSRSIYSKIQWHFVWLAIGSIVALSGCGKIGMNLKKIGEIPSVITPPPPNAVLTPEVDTGIAPSDGDTAAVVVITIRDADGNPLPGYTPVVTGPTGVVIECHASDTQGRASCHISSTQPGSVQLEVQPVADGDSGGGTGGGGAGGGGSGGGGTGGGSGSGGSVVTVNFTEKKTSPPGSTVATSPVTVTSGGAGTISVAGSVGRVTSPVVLDDGFSLRALVNVVGDWFN